MSSNLNIHVQLQVNYDDPDLSWHQIPTPESSTNTLTPAGAGAARRSGSRTSQGSHDSFFNPRDSSQPYVSPTPDFADFHDLVSHCSF